MHISSHVVFSIYACLVFNVSYGLWLVMYCSDPNTNANSPNQHYSEVLQIF